jgi:hypothetical protein
MEETKLVRRNFANVGLGARAECGGEAEEAALPSLAERPEFFPTTTG